MSRRLLGGLAMLLLALGLGSALAWQQATVQQQQLAWLQQTALPSARLLRQLSAQVDELRGMLALHLMLDGSAEAQAMDRQIQARRLALEQSLAGSEQNLADTTERAHFDAARASLALFLAEQDKLLALSRQGTQDAARAAAARALLTGPSQLAYQRLSADLAAWSAYIDQRTDSASRQARGVAAGLPLQLALQAALILAAAALLAWRYHQIDRRSPAEQAQADRAPAARPADRWADWPRRARLVDLAGTVDRLAFEAHLLALNAAVVAARRDDPGHAVPQGQEEGVRHLAQRVAAATREVRQLLVGDAPPVTPPGPPPAAPGSADGALEAAAQTVPTV